ncbi:E3 ubiquitin-protein ligase BRE1-like 1 [Linum grandiflorum]
MESTGEPDRKRRHFSSLSPTAALAKKQPVSHFSDDKKLDAAVLQFQNQKLLQKLEAQKVEYSILESKYSKLKDRQQPYESTLNAVDKSCKLLVNDLEARSKQLREASSWNAFQKASKEDIAVVPEDTFLNRLMETGATESSSANNIPEQMDESRETGTGNVEVAQMEAERDAVTNKMKKILKNIVIAINDLWSVKDEFHAAVQKELSNDGTCRQKSCTESVMEVKHLRSTLSDLHLRHKSLSRDLQGRRDKDAKNKAQHMRLKGELETSVSELRSTNCKVTTLKAERDATKGTFFPVLNLGSKHGGGDKSKEKQKGLHEMESALKELSEQASSRLVALKALHNERIKMLEHLSDLQNSLKNIKCISSSQTFLLARCQLENSKAEVSSYQGIFEKLQVEKDNLLWREKELNMKSDLLDVYRRSSAVMSSRLSELESEITKNINEQHMIKVKLEEAAKEPGRKEVITEFKVLVSSFADDMSAMQRKLSSYKEAASDIHSLRADVQCLSEVLDRKAKQCSSLSSRSMNQVSEMEKLQSLVKDLQESGVELKLISDMYRRESTDSSRDVLAARDSEYQAWAQVQSLKLSLDEQNLELRVKTANEAEAISQQKLAAAEAEIADSREKLEASKREMLKLSNVLKSKSEENEAYLSEIETIGQAYDDMQTQNQHLLQQVTERDDYNIKLVVEGVRARQLHDSLFTDKLSLQKEIQQAKVSLDFYKVKAAKIEDQLKSNSDQAQKIAADKSQNSVTFENVQKRLQDARRSYSQTRELLDVSQSKVEESRMTLAELQIEVEKERFEKRRREEELEIARRKLLYLRAEKESSSVLEKLRQELREYREIVKCSVCHDRPKEVVITKCYHLFCNPCVQKITESRHRKCPVCAASFGQNDVKPVYI